MEYRDSKTLQLAREINNFVRSKTKDGIIAVIALEVAAKTFSLVEIASPEERT